MTATTTSSTEVVVGQERKLAIEMDNNHWIDLSRNDGSNRIGITAATTMTAVMNDVQRWHDVNDDDDDDDDCNTECYSTRHPEGGEKEEGTSNILGEDEFVSNEITSESSSQGMIKQENDDDEEETSITLQQNDSDSVSFTPYHKWYLPHDYCSTYEIPILFEDGMDLVECELYYAAHEQGNGGYHMISKRQQEQQQRQRQKRHTNINSTIPLFQTTTKIATQQQNRLSSKKESADELPLPSCLRPRSTIGNTNTYNNLDSDSNNSLNNALLPNAFLSQGRSNEHFDHRDVPPSPPISSSSPSMGSTSPASTLRHQLIPTTQRQLRRCSYVGVVTTTTSKNGTALLSPTIDRTISYSQQRLDINPVNRLMMEESPSLSFHNNIQNDDNDKKKEQQQQQQQRQQEVEQKSSLSFFSSNREQLSIAAQDSAGDYKEETILTSSPLNTKNGSNHSSTSTLTSTASTSSLSSTSMSPLSPPSPFPPPLTHASLGTGSTTTSQSPIKNHRDCRGGSTSSSLLLQLHRKAKSQSELWDVSSYPNVSFASMVQVTTIPAAWEYPYDIYNALWLTKQELQQSLRQASAEKKKKKKKQQQRRRQQ